MKLALKTFLIITIAVTLGLATILGVASVVLLEDYRAIESRETEAELDRIAGFVQDDIQDLEGSVRGLSDLTGALFGDPDQPANNETTQLFLNLFFVQGIDHLFAYITDENGTTAISFSFDRATFNLTDGPSSLNQTLLENRHWSSISPGAVRSGLLADNGTTYLLAAAPLTIPSFGSQATLTIVRQVDAATNAELTRTAQRDARLDPPTAAHSTQIERHDRTSLTAHRTLEGMDGQPAATLTLDAERTTYMRGVETIVTFAWTAIGIAAVALVAGLFTMQYLVIGRVRKLGNQIRDIQASARLDGRVQLDGKDEVQELAHDFNQLMTALETHEAALQNTNRDLEGFASIASHDLKSPLSSFTLNLGIEKMAATARNDKESLARIAKMRRGAVVMAQRIDTILAYSSSKNATLNILPTDVGSVMKQVLEDLHAELDQSGARIECGPLPVALVDAEMLQQVLQNLISNAIKYRKPDQLPHIRVTGQQRRGACRIHVEDSGRGFATHEVQAMLEPFVRLPGAGAESGHGIGLATVVRILERLGGRLDVEGKPGVGARFTITLPAPQ